MTPDRVTEWAFGTLAEWLTGYTDYDDEAGCQFKIRHIEGPVFAVQEHGLGRYGERRFLVRLLVEEIT